MYSMWGLTKAKLFWTAAKSYVTSCEHSCLFVCEAWGNCYSNWNSGTIAAWARGWHPLWLILLDYSPFVTSSTNHTYMFPETIPCPPNVVCPLWRQEQKQTYSFAGNHLAFHHLYCMGTSVERRPLNLKWACVLRLPGTKTTTWL